MKTILLTGGSSGIGLATAQLLMNKGYCVYSASRRGGGEAQKSGNGGEIIPIKMDVNDESMVISAVQKIVSENSELYAVISNAGNGSGCGRHNSDEANINRNQFFGSVKIRACLPIFLNKDLVKLLL